MFVRALGGEFASLGTGKLIERSGHSCLVEYFDAPISDCIVYDIASADIETVTLPEQTRVYYFNAKVGAWEIGRLLDDHGDSQYVQFPNCEGRWLKVGEIFVRWARPIADPTPFLGGKINETPRFADGRSAFVQSLILQRAVTMGISALASSAVELEAHQIEIVRRVLQDPVQRYLLADEVGLGKTIEAGILIRQCVLDCGDDSLVIIVVPESLVPQWRSELKTKFFLGHCLDQSVHILPFSDSANIARLLGRASMLVIDEAHHLTGYRTTIDPGLYSAIAAAAPQIERILLLSATPALHNERGFLQMLHLLDPDTYALDDEAGFRRRIESRQALAESVAGLTPENALYLDCILDQLAKLFPDDSLLQERVKVLHAITDAMPLEDDPKLIEAVGHLRAHLSEVYRLHRRILRHRRRSIGGLTPGRAGVQVVEYQSSAMARLYEAIEDWRFEESNAADVSENEKLRDDRIRTLGQLLDRTTQYPSCGSDAAGHFAKQNHLCSSAGRHDRIIRLLCDQEIFEARLTALTEAIRPLMAPKQQFVVFCSDSGTADALARGLASRLEISVDRHRSEQDDWLAFNFDHSRPILVCDLHAEEGLNLQGGHKIVVHYDLPLNANRIEQRLGRTDRYGSGDAVKSIVLNCRDDPFETAWIGFLRDGLRVFDRSVASLQYVIEDLTRALFPKLFAEGVEAIADLTTRSAGQGGAVELEMRNIDQQDALDALGTPPSDALDAFIDIDEDWRAIDHDCSAWIEENLHFSRFRDGATSIDTVASSTPFRYRYVTSRPHTLVPLETFYTRCSSAIDQSSAAHLARMVRTHPLTYCRRTSLSRQGRDAGARLLRYGERFISGMWAITQSDDRGRSTAFWRYIPGYASDGNADVFFRFDFIVEADVAEACRVLHDSGKLTGAASNAVVRRGDMALPPFLQTIWLDHELVEVEDSEQLERLNLAYRPKATGQGGRDFNLNPVRWRNIGQLDLPQLSDWPGLSALARDRAETCLRVAPRFIDSLEQAILRATEVDFGRLGQLKARVERQFSPQDEAEWALECALSDALIGGIQAPRVSVDAIRACFLTGSWAATGIVDGRG